MRDWKEISKVVAGRHPGGVVFLESPHFPVEEFPEEAVPFYHEGYERSFPGPDLSPKAVRRFLWEHRNTRPIQRDRAFVETEYDEESDVSRIRVGTMTALPVLERMPHGS